MKSDELRRTFLDFFAQRQHKIVPSAGLIPHHPTAPMFTNSGMMQFVPYFLGEEPVPFDPPRVADVQKCVRLGGKHNDLDAIGRTPRHLSFFEMLGNWSFNDYFKADAIRWAWELFTEVLGLDGDNMWVTVHVSDDDAEDLWADEVGFPRHRIVRLDKDNFWEMGDVGPCGPSSEIFWDYGDEFGPANGPGDPAAENRYVELWNLVFTQFFRRPDGELEPLGSENVDTGAGLERILAAKGGVASVFETDVLASLVEHAASITGRGLGHDDRSDIALKVIADHARTMAFLVNDGVIPSNEGRGYVLRRIIRRAVRYAYLLGGNREVTPPLVERVVELMGDAYPDIVSNRDRVTSTIAREEHAFRRTLERGSTLLDARLVELPDGADLPGDIAFDLYETHGFPLEVTQEIAAERGVEVDVDGYQVALRRAQEISARKDSHAAHYENLTDFQSVMDEFGPTEFVGREEFDTKATVLAVIGDSIFLDRSPFYAESGGQVGDTGTITTETGRAEVLDTTFALPGLNRHVVQIVEGEITPGQEAKAAIDVARRDAIRRNHTGTHVLHWALRLVLGDDVKQQGSLVAPDRLRFDFGPAEALTTEQIRQIEDLANEEILANDPVRHYETSKEHAAELGAIAFFGEKYGDIVRVLEAGRHSLELCGGTHVRALGDIGPLKIVKEESIGSNLRRIEAVTGTGPIERLRHDEDVLAELAGVLNVSTGEVVDGARKRVDEIKALRDEIKQLRQQAAVGRSGALAEQAVDGIVVARVDDVDRDALRDLAVAVRDQNGIRAAVLGGAPSGGGAALVSAVRKDSGLHAAELIAEAAKTIKGGGGKDPNLAIAGGKDAGGLDAALDQVRAAANIAAS
ncbi:MAG TPA: alanine--tRNA ligase [Acidimicrobiales bacterium]|nr:alanine--tRNA ligase [Acidimicrobiales bacterium]